MSEQLQSMGNRAVNAIMLWKLAVLELLLMCAISAGTFYLSGMADTNWHELSDEQRFKFKIGMWLNVITLIKAFLSKTVSGLAKGGVLPPDVGGDTQMFKRTDTQTQTVSVSQTPKPI